MQLKSARLNALRQASALAFSLLIGLPISLVHREALAEESSNPGA